MITKLTKPILWYTSIALILSYAAAIHYATPALLLLPILVGGTVYIAYQPTLAWYVLIAVLALSTEYNVTTTLTLDVPDEPLMIYLTLLTIILLALKHISIPQQLYTHSITSLVLLSTVWALVTAGTSSSIVVSIKYILAKVWYIIPFLLLTYTYITSTKQFIILATILCSSMLCTVVYIMIRHTALGLQFTTINDAVAPFYRNHVNYAAMLVCCIPIIYYAILHTTKVTLRNILIGVIILCILALILTYSRGAWLALVVGVVAQLLIKKKLLCITYITAILFIIGAVTWLAQGNRYLQYHHNYKKTIFHANFNDHINATFAGTDMSNAERINRWVAAVRLSSDHMLVGTGPNTFTNNYKPYMVSYYKTWVSANTEQSTVHNYMLLLLTEQGIPALVLYLLLIGVALYKVQKLYHKYTIPILKSIVLCVGVVLCMVVTLNMLSDLIEADKIGSLYYLCLGCIIVLDVRYKQLNTT